MRLSQQTQQVIRDTVREVFGVEANVKLFGSRINDDARSGDIDLLVELPPISHPSSSQLAASDGINPKGYPAGSESPSGYL